MAITHKPLVYEAREELIFFEKTPKRVIYALLKDFAQQYSGEINGIDGKQLWLEEAKRRVEVLKANGLIK